MGNYRAALDLYLKLLEKDKDNLDFRYFIARCYLNINDDKSLAIPHLEAIWSRDQSNPEVLLDLGRSYHYVHEFDKAIKIYHEYKALIKDIVILDEVDHFLEMCQNGKELIKYPLDITLENLGKNINSAYPDFTPRVPNDESYIVFTSRRKGNKGNILDNDGYYTSDVYMSRVKKGEFKKAANVGNINSEADEEVAGISPDGSTVIIFVDDMFQAIYANIYISKKKGRSLRPLISISDYVNTPTTLETSGTITADGELLYFSSNVKGGFGGMDLYVSRIMPDGTWGVALNLGPAINTKYDEEFPMISYDGAKMYFSSTGHTSMGGYDLFVSQRNPATNKWSAPSNLGYPLNTAEDNMNISFSAKWDMDTETESNRHAYIAMYHKDGYGDLDIYRVTFNNVEPQLTAIRGEIREKVLIDYSVRKKFYYYTKGDKKIMVPEELYPWYDDSWSLDSEKEVIVEPGYEYKTMLYFAKDGVQKPFSTKKFPKDNSEWDFIKIRSAKVKIKGYVAPKILYKERPLPETAIYVTNSTHGQEYSYVCSQNGKYIMILPQGTYEMMIEAEGYEPKFIRFTVYDKGSYVAEIIKDYVFEKEE